MEIYTAELFVPDPEIKWDISAAGEPTGDNIDIIKKNTGTLTNANKEVGLEVNT
jgi:hypothetical protein